ncbi:hypothetical protein B0H13DRAFT_2434892 [Mycena leptocephala]|nr:hypothetical protein B0H13DRAFT_2434892 [Mycena leptocephala]
MSDQCALDANGKLIHTSEIEFYESESDAKALPAKSTGQCSDYYTLLIKSFITGVMNQALAPKASPAQKRRRQETEEDEEARIAGSLTDSRAPKRHIRQEPSSGKQAPGPRSAKQTTVVRTTGTNPPQFQLPDMPQNQQLRVLTLCAGFYREVAELVVKAYHPYQAKTEDQVLAHYYKRSPANDSDPLSMLWHSKRLCDNLVGDLVSPNQMRMTSHTNLQLAEVSKPTPPPHNASNSSQSAARVTRRVCVGRGCGRIIPPEDLAIACSECKPEGVKDGKHSDEVNKLPLSVVVSPGVTSADSSSNRVSAKASTHGETSWAKTGQFPITFPQLQSHGNHSLSATSILLTPVGIHESHHPQTTPSFAYGWPIATGFPPLWSQARLKSQQSRQEMCETLPWFRSFHGGVYQKKGVAKGYMLSSFGSERDCFLHGGEFIISHGGGGTHTDGTVEDQKNGHPSVRALINNCSAGTPLVILVDDKYPKFPLKLKNKKIYLAALAEVHDVSGSKVVRYKFAFQWTGWMCLNPDCPQFWTGARPEGLEYISDFLQLRESPVFPSDFDARLVPENHIPAAVAASFQLMRGWHCHRCGHLDRDQNLNVAQDTHPILGGVHTAAALQSVGPVTRGIRVGKWLSYLGITKLALKRYSHSNGWGFCQSFALPDNRGTVHHIRGSDSLNYLANRLLENYQIQAFNGSLKLRRYPLKKRTGPFFRTFSRTIYVAGSGQTIPLNDAPSAVVDAHHLIESRVAVALGQPCIFNEVLSVAYLDAQSMAFHSDNEIGLGPVVAGLSLGSPATMAFRTLVKPEGGQHRSDLSLVLQHGDILVMEGAGVQEHYQHAVEPQGFRIAVTARYIAPGKRPSLVRHPCPNGLLSQPLEILQTGLVELLEDRTGAPRSASATSRGHDLRPKHRILPINILGVAFGVLGLLLPAAWLVRIWIEGEELKARKAQWREDVTASRIEQKHRSRWSDKGKNRRRDAGEEENEENEQETDQENGVEEGSNESGDYAQQEAAPAPKRHRISATKTPVHGT